MLPVVAVDLGGTNLRAASFPTGQPPANLTLRVPTHSDRGHPSVIAAIAAVGEWRHGAGVDIVPAESGDDSGLSGALVLATMA